MARQSQNNNKTLALSRKSKRRLLQPGYWGQLEDEEVEFIQVKLLDNQNLSVAWGFKPMQKSHSPDAIRRVAMWGDPKDPAANTKLIRRNKNALMNRQQHSPTTPAPPQRQKKRLSASSSDLQLPLFPPVHH